ncbi:DUF7882 family protein [Leucobacter sp.]
MGTLIYGKSLRYEFEDRTLEHVRFVIAAKLRRKESFFLTWAPHDTGRSGTISLWISPEMPIAFQFSGTVQGPLSREWIAALTRLSYGDRGLVVVPERAVHGRRRPSG